MSESHNIAIIPARSGSKGVPDKNIRTLCGKPMMAYTITAALESSMFTDVLVSTDSELYADMAVQYGAKVPFLRSKKNSSDTADSWAVAQETLEMLTQTGKNYKTVTLLQPTSPLRTSVHIKEAYELFDTNNATAVISVCKCNYSPLLCNTLDDTMSLNGFIAMDTPKRRQDLPDYFRINGAIYIVSTAFLASAPEPFNPYCEGSYAYNMPAEVSFDIDTELDLCIVESIMIRNGDFEIG